MFLSCFASWAVWSFVKPLGLQLPRNPSFHDHRCHGNQNIPFTFPATTIYLQTRTMHLQQKTTGQRLCLQVRHPFYSSGTDYWLQTHFEKGILSQAKSSTTRLYHRHLNDMDRALLMHCSQISNANPTK